MSKDERARYAAAVLAARDNRFKTELRSNEMDQTDHCQVAPKVSDDEDGPTYCRYCHSDYCNGQCRR
jgi:hypothetical protein